MENNVDIFIYFAENQMYQVRAIWSSSEDGSSPPGHSDVQEYKESDVAVANAFLWAALLLSQQYNRVTIFDEGSEVDTFASEAEAIEAYNFARPVF